MNTTVAVGSLGSVVDLNPALPMALTANTAVAFVPMSAASAEAAVAVGSEERSYADVAKGYTPMLNGDILVAKITPCFENGKIVQATLNHPVGFGSTEFHVLRPDVAHVEPRYLLHYLRQPWVRKAGERRMTGSAGQRRVPEQFLAELQVPLPPLTEQRRIAAILDKADELRAKRRATLERLNGLTQAVFLEMFGDPVSNPKAWPDHGLGDKLTFIQYGPRFFNERYSESGIRIVRITDLSENGTLNFLEMPRLNVSEADVERYRLRTGDILFARSGATVGKVGLVQPADPPAIAGAYFIAMRFDGSVHPVYATAVLSSPSIRAIVTRRSRQAAQQNFSGPGLRSLPFPVPPLALQRQFASSVKATQTLNDVWRKSEVGFQELFSSLQHRAFAGEL